MRKPPSPNHSPHLVGTYLSGKPPRYGAPVVALSLIVLTAFSVIYWENFRGLSPYLAGIPVQVFQHHEYWRLFTGIAVHSDPEHLFSNAVLFSVLSFLLYGYFGSFLYPMMSWCFGALVNFLSLMTYEGTTSLVGASGMVYWMAGCWLALYLGIDRRFSLGFRLFRCVGFTLALLMPSTILPSVSYRTHAIGFFLGGLFGICYYFIYRSRFRAFDVYEKEEDDGPETDPQSNQVWN